MKNEKEVVKKKIRIAIVDFAPKEGYLAERLLGMVTDRYDFEITENDPDFVLHSCMGNKALKFDAVRIFYTGEDFRKPSIIDEVFTDKNVALAWRLAFAYTRFKKVDTWDYPWCYTLFVQNGLSIKPNKNLVTNIGFGEGSTHTTNTNSKFANLPLEQLDKLIHPTAIFSNQKADLYEHFCMNRFPFKSQMSLKYRRKRMRRARRFRMKIEKLYQ